MGVSAKVVYSDSWFKIGAMYLLVVKSDTFIWSISIKTSTRTVL